MISEEPIPVSPRRRARLAKPFVNPDADEPNSPKKGKEVFSPLKSLNQTPRKIKAEPRPEFEFSEFLKEEVVEKVEEANIKYEVKSELKADLDANGQVESVMEIEEIDVEMAETKEDKGNESEIEQEEQDDDVNEEQTVYVSSDSEEATSRAEPEHAEDITKSESSPFSNVNFFQTPGKTPAKTPVAQRKRRLEEEETPSRKKQETDVFDSVPHTPMVNDSMDYSQFETPLQEAEPVAPYTAPPERGPIYGDDSANSYSVDRASSLRTAAAGRRISFMPKLDQLQVSEEFTKRLSSSPNQSVLDTPTSKKPFTESSPISTVGDETVSEFKEIEGEIEDNQKEEEGEAEEVQPVKSSKWKRFFKVASLSLLVGSLSVFASWYKTERFEAGYCEASIPRPHVELILPPTFQEYFDKEFAVDAINHVLDYVRPECVPCPDHATCYAHFEAECDPGYIKVNSPLSLGGYLPVAPVCKPDIQKHQRVQMLTEKALKILRDRSAKVECGSIDDAAIEENALREMLYDIKGASLSDEEFNDLWKEAFNDIEHEEDIIVRYIG